MAMRRLVRFLRVKKEWYNPKYVYAAPTYQQAKRTAWRRLLDLIPKFWIEDISRSELYIRTIYGSELYLVGLDVPRRIEGQMLDGIVIDENCDIKPKTFDMSILPTLMWRDSWAWFIGVPKRYGIGAVEYRTKYEQACRGELQDSAGFSWPSSDVMPKAMLEYARKTMDERDFAEQFEASWLSASGGVFHSFDREYNVRPCIYNPDKPILVASDFNVNPLCWLFCHLRGDILEVFDELFLRDANTPKALNVMLGRYANHKGGWQMYGDASSRGRHTSAYETDYNYLANDARLKRMGRTLHYLRSNPPVADRFACTNSRICSGDGTISLFIDPRCSHLITDLEIRSYKPGTRVPSDTGDVGHLTDALGYLCYRKWSLKIRLPISNTVIITKGTV